MAEASTGKPPPRDYHFEDYRCLGGRQALLRGDREVAISTKPYHLLRVLLRHAGQVVSKEALCEAAWPGQIVTDAALARQMARLRRLLGDAQRAHPFIETHRGLGYRFTVPVAVVESHADEAGPHRVAPRFRVLATAAALVLLAGAVAWWWRGPQAERGSVPAAVPEPRPSLSLALVPRDDADDWLSLGGAEYLAERLSREPGLEAVVVTEQSGLSGGAEARAVQLTGDTGMRYAVLVDLGESAQGYEIDLALRSEAALVGNTRIEGVSLPAVFARATDWLANQLAVDRELEALALRFDDAVEPYALESYLLAVAEQQNADRLEVAREYLQAAVNKDAGFLEAWLRLATLELELGENQRALALAGSLLERADVQSRPALASELELITGLAYGRLKQDALSREWLDRAAEPFDGADEPLTRLKVLQAVAYAAQADGRHEEAIEAGQEALALAGEHLPLPNVLADLHVSLGAIFSTAGRHAEAVEAFEAALPHYRASGNTDGILRVFYRLNNHHYTVNQLDEGVQVVHRAIPILDKTSLVHEKAFFLYVSGLILNLRGYFDLSDDFAGQLRQLALEQDNPFHMVLSEFILMHRLYVREEFEQALIHARSIAALAAEEGTLDGVVADTTVVMMLMAARAGDVEEARRLAASFEERFGDQRERLSVQLDRAEGHLAAAEGRRDAALERLRRARSGSLDAGDKHVAAFIGYEILELSLQRPVSDHQALLRQLEQETQYDYVFWKLKARILAQEGDFLAAATLMGENRLRARDLWKPEDQLLLESWQRQLADAGL